MVNKDHKLGLTLVELMITWIIDPLPDRLMPDRPDALVDAIALELYQLNTIRPNPTSVA